MKTFFYFFAGMEDGSVVSSTKESSDGGKGELEFIPKEIHGHLSGVDNFFFSTFFNEIFLRNTVIVHDDPENIFRFDAFSVIFDELF